jgi:hypothetical protein
MHFEINVSKDGRHYFATAERSLTYREQADKVYADFCKRFPLTEGFRVSMVLYQNVGEPIYDNKPTND